MHEADWSATKTISILDLAVANDIETVAHREARRAASFEVDRVGRAVAHVEGRRAALGQDDARGECGASREQDD